MTQHTIRKLLKALSSFLRHEVAYTAVTTDSGTEHHFYLSGQRESFLFVVEDQVVLTDRTMMVDTSPFDGKRVYVGRTHYLLMLLGEENFAGYYQIKPADTVFEHESEEDYLSGQRHTRAVHMEVLVESPCVREFIHADPLGSAFGLEVDGAFSGWVSYDSLAVVRDSSCHDWVLTQAARQDALPRLAKLETVKAFSPL